MGEPQRDLRIPTATQLAATMLECTPPKAGNRRLNLVMPGPMLTEADRIADCLYLTTTSFIEGSLKIKLGMDALRRGLMQNGEHLQISVGTQPIDMALAAADLWEGTQARKNVDLTNLQYELTRVSAKMQGITVSAYVREAVALGVELARQAERQGLLEQGTLPATINNSRYLYVI